MSYRVRILRRAQADLLEIHRYLTRDSEAQARSAIEGLLRAIDSLQEQPMRGVAPRDARLRSQGYRFLVVGQHLVFYKVRGRLVRVYRIVHGRRQYADIL